MQRPPFGPRPARVNPAPEYSLALSLLTIICAHCGGGLSVFRLACFRRCSL